MGTHQMQQSGRMAGEGDYTTAAVNNRAYGKLLRRCAQTDEQRSVLSTWTHNAGQLDNELRSERMRLDEVEEQSESLSSAGFRAGGMGLSMSSKAKRKAARSTNDSLSHAIYKSKGTSSKKMGSLW